MSWMICVFHSNLVIECSVNFVNFVFSFKRLSPHNQVTHSSAFRKSHYFVHFLCSLSAVEHNQFIHRAWFSYSISSSSSKSGYLARLCSYLVILFFHFPQKICSKKLQYLSASSAQQNYSSSAGLGRCSYFVILPPFSAKNFRNQFMPWVLN